LNVKKQMEWGKAPAPSVFCRFFVKCPDYCPKVGNSWGADMNADICARMPGSLTLWHHYFNQLVFSRNEWRNAGPIPYPLAYGMPLRVPVLRDPEHGRIPWLAACGKGDLNGKNWPSGQRTSAGPILCRSLKMSELLSEGQVPA
jgi:hypothetical protein